MSLDQASWARGPATDLGDFVHSKVTSFTKLELLRSLLQEQPASANELARRLQLSQRDVGRALTELSSDGVVERKDGTSEARFAISAGANRRHVADVSRRYDEDPYFRTMLVLDIMRSMNFER